MCSECAAKKKAEMELAETQAHINVPEGQNDDLAAQLQAAAAE